jgi:ABC-type transport system involved in cytochrome c biogenesis permease component
MTQETLFELKCAVHIAFKDLRTELRKKYGVFSMLIFGFISILVFSFSVGPFSQFANENGASNYLGCWIKAQLTG